MSSGIALVFAVSLSLFVLGRGPGTLVWMAGGDSNLRWLPFAGAGVSWLPFNQHVKWMPYKAVVLPTPTPSAIPAPATPTPPPAPTPTARPSTPAPGPTSAPPTSPPATATPTPTPPLFTDNFESYTTGQPPPAGTWTVGPAGAWTVTQDGSKVLAASATGTATAGQATWTNYQVAASVKGPATGASALIMARSSADGQNAMACGFQSGNLILSKRVAGTWTSLASTAYAYSATAYYTVSLRVQGSTASCTVTGLATPLSGAIPAGLSSGSVGAAAINSGRFDNFVVTVG